MLRMYTEKILFHWRHGLIIVLALIALNTIPSILNGIAEGKKKALRDNIAEAQGGEYVLKGYSHGDYTRSVLHADDVQRIDTLFKEGFPDIYEGFRPVLKGRVRISMDPRHQYSAWVEASSDIENDDAVYLSSTFHPDEDEGMARYRVNENMAFRNDLAFERMVFEVPESDNPMLSVRNDLFSFVPDGKASFPSVRRMLDYPADSVSSLILLFSGSPSFSALEDVLSDSFPLWTHDGGDGFSTGVFKTSKYSADTVLSFENLDDDLMEVTLNLMDNGQASGEIRRIEKAMERSRRISRFFTAALSIIIFMTMMMELESRRKEMELAVHLGGIRCRIVSMVVAEKILLTIYSMVLSWAIILMFALLYRAVPLSEPMEALFTRRATRVFSFNFSLSLRLFLVSLAITVLASVVAVSVSSGRRRWMRGTACLLIALLLSPSSLMAAPNPIEEMSETIGERPGLRSVSIIWSSSMAALGNSPMQHRNSRFYEYADQTPGDCKYLKLLYYPREIAGNAILSLEKEHKTFAYEAGTGKALEIAYMPPEALFPFFIPSEYELIEERMDDDGSMSVRITDGVLDYEYLVGEDHIPTMLAINDHETKALISKSAYDLFTDNHAYGSDFLMPPTIRSWYGIHPHDTYVQTSRDTLFVDFPDEVFTLEFLKSL